MDLKPAARFKVSVRKMSLLASLRGSGLLHAPMCLAQDSFKVRERANKAPHEDQIELFAPGPFFLDIVNFEPAVGRDTIAISELGMISEKRLLL